MTSPAQKAPSSTSFLEYAFLRWVLTPAVRPDMYRLVQPQAEVEISGRKYRVDYEIVGSEKTFAFELDGSEHHGSRGAFSYDRMRQNDLHSSGRIVARFSYDSIRRDTERCVRQLQELLLRDPLLGTFVVADPMIETPEMDPDPAYALAPSPIGGNAPMHDVVGENPPSTYFDGVRDKLNRRTLREYQTQAFEALSGYFANGGKTAACVMSVGAGKTALGVTCYYAVNKGEGPSCRQKRTRL